MDRIILFLPTNFAKYIQMITRVWWSTIFSKKQFGSYDKYILRRWRNIKCVASRNLQTRCFALPNYRAWITWLSAFAYGWWVRFSNYVNRIIGVCIVSRRPVILSSRYNRIVTCNDACREERGEDKNVTSRSIIRGCFLAATKTALSTVRVLGTERPVADFSVALLLSRLSASYQFRYCMIMMCRKILDSIHISGAW